MNKRYCFGNLNLIDVEHYYNSFNLNIRVGCNIRTSHWSVCQLPNSIPVTFLNRVISYYNPESQIYFVVMISSNLHTCILHYLINQKLHPAKTHNAYLDFGCFRFSWHPLYYKLVCKDHPWEWKNVVFVDRWSRTQEPVTSYLRA